MLNDGSGSAWSDVARAAVLIFLAEIGDKTFFVAVLLSAKYNACPVFVGCMLALAASTLIAALVGYLLASFIGPTVLTFVAAALFLGFALWLLWEWYTYDEKEESAEKEAQEEIANQERDGYGSVESRGRAASAESALVEESSPRQGVPWWRVVVLAFSMNFIGELGDKTQIAVAVQASTSDPFWVAVGALIGFTLVTAIAVMFGKAIAKLLSPRTLLLAAATAFCFFGVMALIQGINQLSTERSNAQFLHTNFYTQVGFLLKAPVKGTSWSFHTVFCFGLLAGLGVAVLVVLLWSYFLGHWRRDTAWQSVPGSSSARGSDSTVQTYYAPLNLHLFTHRCGWLVALLLMQSLSAEILESFKVLLLDHPNIIYFLIMLVGAGGNSGAQSAVLAVRQMALRQKVRLPEQLSTGCKLAAILAIVGFARCAFIGQMSWPESSAIGLALAGIVLFAVLIGTALPLLLDRAFTDPAHSIAFIQVLMDIFGVCITCFTCVLVLDYLLATPH